MPPEEADIGAVVPESHIARGYRFGLAKDYTLITG